LKFWDIFKSNDNESSTKTSGLHQKITQLLPDENEDELVKCACVAGLLARVAYIDFEIHEKEEEFIKKSLLDWTNFKKDEVQAISKVAIDEIKDLAGLENHLYCHPLNELMDNDEKYGVVESLFAMAASDNEVSGNESEEIRLINNGLRLEHKHFISARATVLEKLMALKDF